MEDVGTKLVNFFVSETIKILQRTACPCCLSRQARGHQDIMELGLVDVLTIVRGVKENLFSLKLKGFQRNRLRFQSPIISKHYINKKKIM